MSNTKTVEQIYTKCLAQGSYFIESNGEAAVIDPLRETEPYLERAEERGVKIKYIFETHFHADFVSGHLSLAKKTGATIVYGPGATTEYDKYTAVDGEEFKVGDLTIRAIHTPGHTPESTCYLLVDNTGKQKAIFTGDTLFIGDVGRPDLAQKSTGLTSEDMAGMLYESLRKKIMPLDNDIIVYPAHGAGSACGKNMSSETSDTLGNQKKSNYALDITMSKELFIKTLVEGLAPPPGYFKYNAKINKMGYRDYEQVMDSGNQGLTPDAFEQFSTFEDVLILDVRDKKAFAEAHIEGAVNVGIDGGFAPWVGEMIQDTNQKIILVCPDGRQEETVRRLSRVGFDQCLGYLKGGMDEWRKQGKETQSMPTVDAKKFAEIYNSEIEVIDFRKPGEYQGEHLNKSKNIPLSEINDRWKEIDTSKPLFIHCKSGYRSSIGGSILQRNGLKPTNILSKVEDIVEEAEAIS